MTVTALRPTIYTLRTVEALGGKWHGYTAMCRCPSHADNTPSLSIRQGDQGLLVTCFAGCNPVDILRAIRQIQPGALPRSAPIAPFPRDGAALRLWNKGLPMSGTPAARYLTSRHLGPGAHDAKFHPRCPLGPKPSTVFKPALLVAARDDGSLRGVQRIFFGPTDVTARKATLGWLGGAAWRPPISDPDRLAIAEGFETAAAYTVLTGITCWASFGARRLPLLDIPDEVTELIIAEDNDDEGRRAGARAAEAYARPGRLIRHDRPRVSGYDWADVLAARARRGAGREGAEAA